jgi:magnesium transporter
MVRALATGEVVMRDWLRLLGRECIVALGLGLTMAFAVAGLGLWRGGPDIALVVALSMVLIVIIGSLIGMSLPFLLSRLRLDPATASAPLITSIADATGVLIYLGIASQVLTLSV